MEFGDILGGSNGRDWMLYLCELGMDWEAVTKRVRTSTGNQLMDGVLAAQNVFLTS